MRTLLNARVAIVCAVVVFAALMASSCNFGNPLVGKWEAKVASISMANIEFTGDGKVIIRAGPVTLNGTYELEGKDKVRITWADEDASVVHTYTVSDNELTLDMGDKVPGMETVAITYTRVEN